jgi:hypothetical protein
MSHRQSENRYRQMTHQSQTTPMNHRQSESHYRQMTR